MSADDDRALVVGIVDAARTCMLTTTTADGRPVSRPMAVQDVEFDGDLWFFCRSGDPKVGEVRARPQVNVAFADEKRSSWASVSGRAEVVQDRAKMEELWSAPLKVWFEDGLETADLALLRVHAETAEYWDASRSKVRQLIGAVRAAVTDDPDAFPATNATTTLDG